ncbi:MAG TPA: HDIG domain-containing protein [Syntrophomonadaceae bacterium]|nr:HDIG domain-containing protein [Syntrophomonadaceae bacterium]
MKFSGLFKYLVWERVAPIWKNSATMRLLGVLGFFFITVLILFSSFNPEQVMLRPDEVASRNIVSNIQAIVIDTKQTEELQKQAASKVQKVYQEDRYALPNARDDVNNFYINMKDILNSQDSQKKMQLENLLKGALMSDKPVSLNEQTSALAAYINNSRIEDCTQMNQATIYVIESVMDKPITEKALPSVYKQAEAIIKDLPYSSQARDIIKIEAINAIRPNMIYNAEATDKAIQEAVSAVKPVQKTVKSGEIIVREGDRVTQEQISVLEQLGIQRNKSYPLTLLGTVLLVLILLWLMMEFLKRYYAEIYNNDRLIMLAGLIIVIILLITKFLTVIKISDQPEINSLIGYLAPVAAGSMLLSILLDNKLAYFITMILALFVGLLTSGNQLLYAITAFVGGTVGVYQVSKVSQTSDLAKSGLSIALANIITIVTLALLAGNVKLNTILIGMSMGAVNGILSAVLMIGVLPYLESAFSVTSTIKLLELSNPNHVLLRKLLLEAPGTYHHSLMVGNLAEASAEAVGANPLLVRVGAYYHDIGKIKRPEYFVENQRGFDNPHEKIAPALSTLIITSHVKEGMELGREAHLPDIILDFIEQHHGTSLAKYFYSRALEEDRDRNISEESFRYEGPKPHTKEIALVMLADSVEAAVRSLPDPTQENIREMVHLIINDKLDDGQLEECDLTFKDLDTIENSFCKLLEGVYHKRIEYPEVIAGELQKRRESHGDHDNQPAEQG